MATYVKEHGIFIAIKRTKKRLFIEITYDRKTDT